MRAVIDSPVGPLLVEASERGVSRIEFMGSGSNPLPRGEGRVSEEGPVLLEAARQLAGYFAGRRRVFDLPLDLGGSDFQRRVWRAIAAIPFGETASYAAVATAAGSPTACRAAGAACGANPVAIVIPCHRVVASDGGLQGFGGGLAAKAWLLAHERLASQHSAPPDSVTLSPLAGVRA